VFDFLISIGEWIFGIFQTSSDAIVTSLVWAVGVLQTSVILIWNAIKDAAGLLRDGFIKVWDFFKPIYDDVLLPAWQKFWTWFQELTTWLKTTFGPILNWLVCLRKQLLDFWSKYVRPWLDLIDVTRKLLSTLAALGLSWAKALDARLSSIEQAIQAPFLYVLGKLNEIINIVNNVITLDGLIQRVALVKSIVRDYQYVGRAIVKPYVHNQTPPGTEVTSADVNKETPAHVADAITAYMVDGTGDYASTLDELNAIWTDYLTNGLPSSTP
jgi:hypothetical protein